MEFYDDKISRLNVDLFIVDGLPAGKLAKKLTKLSPLRSLRIRPGTPL